MNTSQGGKVVGDEKNYSSFLVLGTLLVLTIGVSLLPASWFGVRSVTQRYKPLDLSIPNAIDQVAQDTNRDGTVSWKEFVAGSLDIPASEVGQDTAKDLQADPRSIAALNDPNNLTSSFSKNLYIASTVLQQNGVTDQKSEQETINQLVKEEATKVQPTTYTIANIKIGKDDSKAAVKAYGNAVASILNGFITEQSIVDDITALGNFTNSNDEADLASIFKSKSRVSLTLQKLLDLSVPPSAVVVHVQALNNIGTFSQTLNNLSKAFDDPMRATLAIKRYPDDAVTALHTFPQLAAFFKEKGVTFSEKDTGYVFVVGYTGK